MILLLVVALAVVVAVLRRGRIGYLADFPLRWPALPLVAFAAQWAVLYGHSGSEPVRRAWHATLLVASYLALAAAVWINRHLPGMLLLGLGLALNLLVMVANGGYMPIAPEVVEQIGHGDRVIEGPGGLHVAYSKDIVRPREETPLWVLGDIIPLPPPFPIPSAVSPGDVLIATGAFWLIQVALGASRRTPAPGTTGRSCLLSGGRPAPGEQRMRTNGGPYVARGTGTDRRPGPDEPGLLPETAQRPPS